MVIPSSNSFASLPILALLLLLHPPAKPPVLLTTPEFSSSKKLFEKFSGSLSRQGFLEKKTTASIAECFFWQVS
jgi:hypothetical protein